MRFPEKTIYIKNGRTAILRSPAATDAAEMLAFLKTTAAETDFMLRYPEECETDIPAEEVFLKAILASKTDLMILCEIDGEIAGNCHISRSFHLKLRHKATVAIGLIQKYWSLGIGTAMMQELTAIAYQWGVSLLELDYIEGNERARRLYEKQGYQETARIPCAYRMKDGTLRQNIIMQKYL